MFVPILICLVISPLSMAIRVPAGAYRSAPPTIALNSLGCMNMGLDRGNEGSPEIQSRREKGYPYGLTMARTDSVVQKQGNGGQCRQWSVTGELAAPGYMDLGVRPEEAFYPRMRSKMTKPPGSPTILSVTPLACRARQRDR